MYLLLKNYDFSSVMLVCGVFVGDVRSHDQATRNCMGIVPLHLEAKAHALPNPQRKFSLPSSSMFFGFA